MHAMNQKLLARRVGRGFTLVEILIALTVGLFLMGALLTIVQTNRRVFGEQNQLAQMQDNQRMAMTMMGDVIQSAGYFPDPVHNTLTTALTATGAFAVGQSIFGTSVAGPLDTIQVRYMTAGGDGILNCSGQSNPTGGPNTVYVNTFQVLNGKLVCTLSTVVNTVVVNTVQYILVGGIPGSGLDITNMSILYGVKADATQPGNNVDTYMSATQVNGAVLWGSVISVQITLTFTNPLSASPGQPATFQIQRVIGVMSQTGPTI
jgi:type IV pilus assembly protein PilW